MSSPALMVGMGVPTENQYRMLRNLASGAAGLSWKKRDVVPMLRREWVTAELRGTLYQWVRITPAGLHALARSVEKYGLPDLAPKLQTTVRVCGKCGSDRYRFETREVDGPTA